MSDQPVVVAFGELLMRLDAPRHERFQQADSFRISFTGGEANVAVALAQWGIPSRIVSRVPVHSIGTACLNHFRRYGVDVNFVARGGERLGILFVETGASQRSSQVIYDRLHTSFRTPGPQEFPWDRIMEGARWFHFTGTAPALGEPVLSQLRIALQMARSQGLGISFDCSYRSALWSLEAAASVLPELMPLVDVFLGSDSDARQFFGIDAMGEEALLALRDKYHLQCVAFTDRKVQPTGINTCSAIVATQHHVYASRSHDIDVVDRIGAGDAFSAGIIRGLLQKEPIDRMTEQALAAAVLTHSIPGDFALLSWDEVQTLATATDGSHSGRGWR